MGSVIIASSTGRIPSENGINKALTVQCSVIVLLSVNLASRWFLAVMPSSEEESQWLVGSGGGLAPSGGSATKTGAGERGVNTRSSLYTEEMTTQPANVATAGVNSASADSAEHDLIDSTADATLLAQFHEDAIKQVIQFMFHCFGMKREALRRLIIGFF